MIAHEYGHALQSVYAPGFPVSEQGMAVAEGFADYVAARHVEDATGDARRALCLFAWDARGLGADCARRLDGHLVYPRDLTGESHADGGIWSEALWSLRSALGRRRGRPPRARVLGLPAARQRLRRRRGRARQGRRRPLRRRPRGGHRGRARTARADRGGHRRRPGGAQAARAPAPAAPARDEPARARPAHGAAPQGARGSAHRAARGRVRPGRPRLEPHAGAGHAPPGAVGARRARRAAATASSSRPARAPRSSSRRASARSPPARAEPPARTRRGESALFQTMPQRTA